jgi:hypothetical protein
MPKSSDASAKKLYTPAAKIERLAPRYYNPRGGEKGPVILVVFKAIDPVLRGPGGGFDSHTLPPKSLCFRCSYSLERWTR